MHATTDYYEFYELGAGDPDSRVGRNGKHGRPARCGRRRIPERPKTVPDALRVAVIGRPNVGKSSFINRLLGEDRLVVSDEAGTTRDSIDTPMHVPWREFIFVDTAGLRRQSAVDEGHRVLLHAAHAQGDRSRGHLRADDRRGRGAPQPGPQDRHARVGSGRGLIMVVNKWDL
jgi:GTPase